MIVATLLIALLEWGLTFAFASMWFENNLFLGRVFSILFIIMPAGYASSSLGSFLLWKADIYQQYGQMTFPELYKEGLIWSYLGDSLLSQFGMPILIAAIVLNIATVLFLKNAHHVFAVLDKLHSIKIKR